MPQRNEAHRGPHVRGRHGLDALLVSDTAKYGDLTAGKKVIDGRVRETMKTLLADVKDGSFAKDWMLENQCGGPG
jgi:ketol-acid reductoisomerase